MGRFCLTLIMTIFLATPSVASELKPFDQAVGQIVVASWMHDECKGITRIGGDDQQQFVLSAVDIAARKGVRKGKLKLYLFYGKGLSIPARQVLKERGIDPENTGEMCSLARKVAGRNDTIGRFLIKE